MINILSHVPLRNKFRTAEPFSHVVIDNFFTDETAAKIASSFPTHDDPAWTVSYDNPVEKKKACSNLFRAVLSLQSRVCKHFKPDYLFFNCYSRLWFAWWWNAFSQSRW
jgi:hypothetical protein